MPWNNGDASNSWSTVLIELWGRLSQERGWPTVPYGRQKGARVSDLTDILCEVLGRFGRPKPPPVMRATDENVVGIDLRLRSVETEQREIEARLRRLEVQSWRD